MSYGYIRKQSPAMKSSARIAAGARRYGQLTKLHIDSVDAGVGTRVAFFKSQEFQMEDILKSLDTPADQICKRALAGEVPEPIMFAAMSKLAEQYFPLEKSRELAWVKFTEGCAIGKRMELIRHQLPRGTFEQREDLAKALAVPHAERAQPQPDDDNGEDPDEQLKALAEQHRKEHPELTHAQAVAAVLATPEGNEAYQRAKATHLRKNSA